MIFMLASDIHTRILAQEAWYTYSDVQGLADFPWVLNPKKREKPLDGDFRASFSFVRIPYAIKKTVIALGKQMGSRRTSLIQSYKTAAYTHE